ncbi:uncharacterized protein LOC124170377 [Ischnura elegans]|uniref:uncharacterized protein LOC124170377 n=1 Tax=Ischnura elegans TaxID=197161 RepID=UPI001ED8A656|nr:uncharacterized protein LOC124170377 [Ischnura elegans]
MPSKDEEIAELTRQLNDLRTELQTAAMQNAEAQQALVGQHQQALADQAQQFQQAFAAEQQKPQPLLPPQQPPQQQPSQPPPPQHDAEANAARLQATNQQEACRVAVKLPSFWPSKPSFWFAQAEAQFELANITREETKYNHAVSILDNYFAEEVEDILSNPPAQNRYEHLKNELIRRLSLSEEKRVRQLLQAEELGDRQPSQLLRHLRSLNGSFQIQDTLLRQIWLTRLPITVQAILQAQTTLPLDELAKIADRIVEITPLPPPPALAVNAVASSTDTSAPAVCATTSSTDFSSLARRLGSLEKQLTALLSQLNDQHRRSRSSSRSRDYFPSRSRSPSKTYHPADDASLCYYHRRFGNAARRCQAPCSRATENSSGEQ